MSTPTNVEFARTVLGHLRAAAAACPTEVPTDIFDQIARPMMDELQALMMYLHDIGAEQREQLDREEARERRLKAKAANPNLEYLVMRLDERIQKSVEALGSDPVVGGMMLELLTDAFVQFTDAMPATACAVDRLIPSSFPSHYDATVDGIIALLRARRGDRA